MEGVAAESSQRWLDSAWLQPNAPDGRDYAAVQARPAQQVPELGKGAPSRLRLATKSLRHNVPAGRASGPSNTKRLRNNSYDIEFTIFATEGLTAR